MSFKQVHPLTRVEGASEVIVKIHKRKVQELELNLPVLRKFETLLRGKRAHIIPSLVTKVCGVCPFSHQIAASIALEKALNVEAPPLASSVRRLILSLEHIRSHSYNLFLMGLQDATRLLGMDEKLLDYRLLRSGLNVIRFADRLLSSIAGGPISPGISTVGGLLNMPIVGSSINDLEREVKKVLEDMNWALNISKNLSKSKYYEMFNLERTPALITSFGRDMDPINGTLKVYEGTSWRELEVLEELKDLLTRDILTGPLARQTLISLHYSLEEGLPIYNLLNLYMLRILEIINALSYSMNLLRTLKDLEGLYRKTPQKKSGFGRCFVEAPRGTLIYECEVEEEVVKSIKIITPTELNLPFLKAFSRNIVERALEKGLPVKEAVENLKTAIRAFDPCISCATHITVVNED
ncbi:MAG: nickel-dependent hydrogenase large subunit [Candidatus Bathyarchaeia archaeon]